jgi:hypothetical protein
MTSDVRNGVEPTETIRRNPYAGPRALQQGEPIYGRVREINELRGAILSERIVLLYSQSGAGKTSLIEAGLRPEFEQRRFKVLATVRVGYESPLETPEANRYRLSVLASLESARPVEEQLTTDELSSISLKDYFQNILDAEPDLDLLVVFDQFEEIFTLDPTDWDQKEAFLHELGVAMANRSIFALFSMREDFIAQLDPYQSFMPTRFSNTYRLELLGPSDARLAIQKPAEVAGVEFADDAAQGLVDDLRRVRVDRGASSSVELGPSVEPVQLQVVCAQLWAHLEPDAMVIRSQNVDDIGNVNEALAGYYASEVAAVAEITHVKERVIRDWFEEKLISDDGFRTQTREGPGGKSDKTLPELENAHLIRADRRRGTQWYELTHDRFVEPIRTSNTEFHRRRRKKLLKFLIPMAIIALMALTSIAFDALRPTSTELAGASAEPLTGASDEKAFDVAASTVKRYRFDDGSLGDEVTLVVTAIAQDPSIAVQPEVDIRLLQVGTEDSGDDLEAGATKAVPPSGATGIEAAAGAAPAANENTSTTSTTKATQEIVRPIERRYSLPTDGSYFVEISASGDALITLSYNRTAGTTAPKLEAGEVAQGTLDVVGAIGRFDFTADKDEVVEINLESFDPLDGVLTMIDETGNLIESADLNGAGGTEVMVKALPASGTYTINVSGYEGTTGTYRLGFARPSIMPISLGSSAEYASSGDGSASVFSFSASEGETILVSLVHDEKASPTLEVQGEFNRQFGLESIRDLTIDAVQIWSGGDGLVVVNDESGSPGDFLLEITTSVAIQIEPGVSFDGSLAEGETQYFAFEGSQQEIYSVVAAGPDGYLDTFAPGGLGVVNEVFMAPFDGTYLVSLDPETSGDFSIVVTKPELEEITFGDSVTAKLAPGEGILAYLFAADAGDTYSVVLEADTPVPFLGLLVTAPDGFADVSDFEDDEQSLDISVSEIAPLKGLYLITASVGEPGTYTISLDR